jgi:hypothetical protein
MTDLSVEVFVGGRPADILYRGRSGFTGIDQINFRYPSDLNGCRLPLTVRVGGVLSNFGAVAVAPNEGACSDPTSFPGQVMTEIAKMNEVRLGAIKLQRIAARIRTPEEDVSFVFDLAEGGIFFYPTRFFLASLDYFSVYTPLGTCRIDGFLNTHNEDFFASDPTATAGLDAGPVLNLTGPNGTQVLARLPEGEYEKDLGGGYPGEVQLPPFLSPGTYTIDNGAGGFEVGPFRATLSFPAPLNWTNRDSLQNISRSEDLKLTWNGADANTEFVVIVGTSTDYDKNARATFTCTERADAGAFTVPQMFLSALPASAGDWQNQEMPSGILMVGTASQLSSATFQAPGAGFGYFIRMHLDAINVMFQ